jgi:hypothetical protein
VLKTYEGAGHFVPEEKPILVAEDIPRYFSEQVLGDAEPRRVWPAAYSKRTSSKPSEVTKARTPFSAFCSA